MNIRDASPWDGLLGQPLSRRRALRGLALAGAGFGAAAIFGCGGEAKPKAEPSAEVSALRLPQTAAFCDSGQYLSEKYLAEEGFAEVKFVPFQAPKTPFSLLATDEADFAVDGIGNLVARVDAGEPLSYLAGFHVGCGAIFGSVQIKSVADFRGRAIGVTGTNPLVNTDYYSILTFLGAAGLDPARDVTFVTRPGPVAQFAPLFNEGKFEGFYTGPPGVYQARAANLGHEVVNLMKDRPWADNYCCGIAASRTFVQKNPVATKRALRALLNAAGEAASQPEAAARYLAEKGYRQTSDDALHSFHEMEHSRWRERDHEAGFRLWLGNLKASGLIKAAPDKLISDGVNLTFLNELKQVLSTPGSGSTCKGGRRPHRERRKAGDHRSLHGRGGSGVSLIHHASVVLARLLAASAFRALLLPLQLIEAHRLLDAAQRHIAAVGEDEALAADQLPHHVRHQYFPARCQRRRARRDDHGRAEEVVVLGDRLAGVEADRMRSASPSR